MDPGCKEIYSPTLSHWIQQFEETPEKSPGSFHPPCGLLSGGPVPLTSGARQPRAGLLLSLCMHLPEHMSGPTGQMLLSASGQCSVEVSLGGNIPLIGIKPLNQQSPELGGPEAKHLPLGHLLSCSATTGSHTGVPGQGEPHTGREPSVCHRLEDRVGFLFGVVLFCFVLLAVNDKRIY